MTTEDNAHTFEGSRRGYDRLAPVYEGLEYLVFGSALMRARTALLQTLPPLTKALVLGEGDGRFLRALLKTQPRCQVTCVEGSPGMVQRAQRRLLDIDDFNHAFNHINFTIQDARSFIPEKRSYDAIFTTFFLDCFTEAQLREFLPQWLKGLKRSGLWYYADFQQPAGGFAALRANAYLSVMHSFFRWQTALQPSKLVGTEPLFRENGLRLRLERSHSHKLLTTKVYRYA